MRKILLILALVFLIYSVNALTVTQEQVNSIDFTNTAVWTGGYEFGVIQLTDTNGFWQIYTVVYFDTLTPITSKTYEVVKGERAYYSEPDFALCWFLQPNNAVGCFEQNTLPKWIEQFYADDFMQRRYLTSLKTKGNRVLPYELTFYLT